MATLSLDQVKRTHGCEENSRLFLTMFGQGGEVTYERCMASAHCIDYAFASKKLLTPLQQAVFRSIFLGEMKRVDRSIENKEANQRRALAFAFFKAYNWEVKGLSDG
jgi:hypothetical protein